MFKKPLFWAILVIAGLLGAVTVLAFGGGDNESPRVVATAPPATVDPASIPTSTPATLPPTKTATTPPITTETTPTEEVSTVPGAPPVVEVRSDGYTYLFGTIGFDLGRTWKVVRDKVQPNDRVFVVEASCEDYAGHCRGIAVVNKVNAPVKIRLTNEDGSFQIGGNTDPTNKCYSDGGLHDNTYYQWPYNDGKTKFGPNESQALTHRIHKVCGRDKGSDASKERMHSWENADLLMYDTDMANPDLGADLLDMFGRARWLQFNN